MGRRSNAAGRYSGSSSGSGGTQQTQRWNDDGSLSTIVQPYVKPTTYSQSDRNSTSGIPTDPSTNLTSKAGWAGFFKGNSPLGVQAGFTPNSSAIANAAGVTPEPTNAATVAAPATPNPAPSQGFSFGAGMNGLQTSPPLVPMSAADHINAAVQKGIAATNALGLTVPNAAPRTFGNASSSSVAPISGAPQQGDTIISKYGTGSVTAAQPANAADRLQKLAAPDHSDITNIYG